MIQARDRLVELCEAGLVSPYKPENVMPASVNLTLGRGCGAVYTTSNRRIMEEMWEDDGSSTHGVVTKITG